VPKKGVDVSIRAFAAAQPRLGDAELWIVGDGEEREALERLASKLLERETLDREDVATMLHDVQRVGTLAFSWPSGPAKPGSGLGLV